MENKKIKGATEVEYDGIKFRSKKEASIYRYLKSIGINPSYETTTAIIWNRDSFSVPYYDRYGKTFKRVISKPIRVSYTPDFIFDYEGYRVILEVKGFKNDVANYKIRLFRDWLEERQKTMDKKLCYAVVYTKKELEFLLEDLHNSV